MSAQDDTLDPLALKLARAYDRDRTCACGQALPRGSTVSLEIHRDGRRTDQEGRSYTAYSIKAFCEPCALARAKERAERAGSRMN